jgi:hypothetical protein
VPQNQYKRKEALLQEKKERQGVWLRASSCWISEEAGGKGSKVVRYRWLNS